MNMYHSLWILQRLNALTTEIISKSSKHAEATIRLHTMRVLAEQADTSAAMYQNAVQALTDKNPHVQRAAVELIAKFVHLQSVGLVIAQRKKTPQE
jgi:hypothetical protein